MEILKKQTFNASELADIREVSVDPNLGREERIAEFCRQIGDPYHFRVDRRFIDSTKSFMI